MPSLAHAVEHHHPLEPSRPRARAISRPERIIAARVFSAACDASGLSNRCLARWLGVDERRVREMRAGLAPVSLDTLLRVPPSVEHVAGLGLIEHAKSRAVR
jgi:hypothetical protein